MIDPPQTQPLQPCIYCGNPFDPFRGEGDHVLPSRLFGEFENDIRFRGMCSTCNNAFGSYEQVLSQSSQLGFYRRVVNPNLGRRANRGGLVQRGAHGSPPPQTTAMLGSRRLLVATDPLDPTNITPVDHLMITAEDGKAHHVRLFVGMTSDRLRDQIEQLSIGKFNEVVINCAPAAYCQLNEIVRQAFPGWQFEQLSDTEPGNYRLRGTTRFEFSGKYFQGLAKIAFHYYLVHNRRGYRGNEPAFSDIRKFIQNGGSPERHFHGSGRTFKVPYGPLSSGEAISPRNWCHVMAAIEDGGPLVVYMQLFVGPGSIPPPNLVTLGAPTPRIMLPSGAFGHVFKYDKARVGRYAGKATAIELVELR